jgi:hypothetical protein
VHGIAKKRQNLLRAAAAGLVLIGIAGFAAEQLAIFEGHASSANHIFAVANVNVIELSHGTFLNGYSLFACGGATSAARILVSQF